MVTSHLSHKKLAPLVWPAVLVALCLTFAVSRGDSGFAQAQTIKVPLEKHYSFDIVSEGNATEAAKGRRSLQKGKYKRMQKLLGKSKLGNQDDANATIDNSDRLPTGAIVSETSLARGSGTWDDDIADDDDYGAGGTIRSELNNRMHVTYLGPISFGNNPSQDALVVYDTGSSWLSITSSLCGKCPIQKYDPEKSPTHSQGVYKPLHQKYGTVEVFGEHVEDTVCVVGYEQDTQRNTCASRFGFLAITRQFNFEYQGVLGFAPDTTEDVPNFLMSLKEAGKIDQAIISFSLGHNSTFRQDIVQSFVLFGGLDRSQFVGDLNVLPLASRYYWAPKVEGIAYGGAYLAKWDDTDFRLGVLDTGTPLIHLPKKYYDVIVDKWKSQIGINHKKGFAIGASGLWEAEGGCQRYVRRISNFSVIFGKTVFEITPQAYLLNCSDLKKSFCTLPDYCAFGIDSMDSLAEEFDENMLIFGDVFLKNFYSVFSMEGEPSISLALSKHYSSRGGIRTITKEVAGFTLSMFIMFSLTIGLYYIYGNHQKIWMEKRISNIMFLFRMDLARERSLSEQATNRARAEMAAKLSGSHRPPQGRNNNYNINEQDETVDCDEDIEQLDERVEVQ